MLQVLPDRTVAYLNLADVTWNLGKTDEAKGFYAQYLVRMRQHSEAVPARVHERTK